MAAPIITLRTTGTQLSCPEGENCRLDVLERHDVEVEYQCRSGSCRVKLLEGKVAYRQ